MRTQLSPAIIALAERAPGITRMLLRCLSGMTRQPHWIVSRIAYRLDYFPSVDARLGNGMTIRVLWGQIVGTGILVNGYHEPHTTRVFEKLLRPGMTFVDVGAHVGQYTLLAAGLVGPQGRVHSFEPDPRTFALLQHNVSANGLTNVTINHCAVAATTGADSALRTQSLDDYIAARGIAQVDLIKIDIDGGEMGALRGARRLLSSAHPPQLIVEFAESTQAPRGHSCAELAEVLTGLGNELFCIDSRGLIPFAPWGPEHAYFNVLAVPKGTQPVSESHAAAAGR
ncbi:MAG: FkbM family methyltransferase [Bryobacteraceae bacterium]|jgi:hypothetical protein